MAVAEALEEATPVELLGVKYLHLKTANEGDLYVTEFGQPFFEHLKPGNWKVNPWFKEKREPLPGTSAVFKLPTKEVNGRSIDLVVKYRPVLGGQVGYGTDQ